MKNQILEEIQRRKEIYKTSPADMISAYNREIETEKEYNGRQLLELLQNADDEKSNEVKIELDTQKQVLSIANRGEARTPFSFEGIRSLMISNLSSKTTKKFIGNKGLGFRSVINWSSKVTISSNGLDIIFSREIVEKVYDELFTTEEHKRMVEERNLPDSVKPIPFLSIPYVAENHNNDWTTVVSIEYKKKFESDIKKQIDSLKPEILLFLNSIKKLIVVVDSEGLQEIKKDDLNGQWKIYSKREMLPKELWDKENEAEYYDLKIALQNDLECDVPELFAFFPTKIEINFPYIVHGTFELNSSRNEIIDSEKNRYILKELVNLIVETAKTITNEEVSYKALEMLTYSNPHKILSELGFYEAIDDAIEELEIFPCVDGVYRKKDEVVFADALASFVLRTHNEDLFPNLLIPKDTDVELESIVSNIEVDNDHFDALSRRIKDINDRVDFIYILSDYSVGNKLVFLVDEHNALIELQDDVFTPAQSTLDIPDFVNIKFIHNELFKKLIRKFGITSEHKSRALLDRLKGLTNIQEYAFKPVVHKIVASARKELETDESTKVDIIKALVRSMYNNYNTLGKAIESPDVLIPLLSRVNGVANANDLYLSESYPSGELTEYLFGDTFDEESFLADVSTYDFDPKEEKENIEAFFMWLGVNKYTKYENTTRDFGYSQYLIKLFGRPENYDKFVYSEEKIVHFEKIISSLSREKILLWLLSDTGLKSKLERKYELKYIRSRGYHPYHVTPDSPSYIRYQLLSSEIFKDYLISGDNLSKLVNDLSFDFESRIFEKYDINRFDIESLMLKIGAVDKFEKLSITKVRDIVKELPNRSPDGKQTQTIYKFCVKHFEKNAKPLSDDEVLLYATKNEKRQYYPLKEVYYSWKKLPKNITDMIPILNYPRKQSITNVVGFFGINSLNDLKIEILKMQVLDRQTNEFTKLFEQLKPYILTYRIKDMESEQSIRDDVVKLQRIRIKLCDNVLYKLDEDLDELSNNDYVQNGNEYLIKINEHDSIDKLRKEEVDFQESFADIVGLAFNIQDTNVFRDIIIKEDVAYIEKIVRNDIGYDELTRARRLLGISDEYYSFWATVYELLHEEFILNEPDDILTSVQKNLGLDVDISKIDYNHLNTFESSQIIKKLFQELQIDIKKFNHSTLSYYKIDFTEYHKRRLKEAFENHLLEFKRKLYTWSVEHSQQRQFLSNIAKYENCDAYILNRASESKDLLDLDYNSLVFYYIKQNFELENIYPTQVDFEKVRGTNESIVEEDALKGNLELLSLLYFEDGVDKIKDAIKPVKDDAKKIGYVEVPKARSIVDVAPIRISSISRRTAGVKTAKPYKHPGESQQRDKGKESEQIAYVSLVEKYGVDNVFKKSNEDDSAGYDLKYKDTHGEWKYVEVKSYSDNHFYLTRNEKEFADKHKGQYEIFLVGDEIFRIKEVDFSDSSKFKLMTKDYIVWYSLD